MGAVCNFIGQYGCLPTEGENLSSEKAIRNAKIRSALTAVFATLAAVALAVGVAGFFGGKLAGAASIMQQNALWVTVAGGAALALMLITAVGYQCYKRSQESESQAQPAKK